MKKNPSEKVEESLREFIQREREPQLTHEKQAIGSKKLQHTADEASPRHAAEKQAIANRRRQLQNESEEQKQKLQKEFAKWAKLIVSLWLIFIAILLVAAAVTSFLRQSQIFSDKVLITLLTATTVNVLGMVIIVIKGLFANK